MKMQIRNWDSFLNISIKILKIQMYLSIYKELKTLYKNKHHPLVFIEAAAWGTYTMRSIDSAHV